MKKRIALMAAIGLSLPSLAWAAQHLSGACCPGLCCILGCPMC